MLKFYNFFFSIEKDRLHGYRHNRIGTLNMDWNFRFIWNLRHPNSKREIH